LLVKALRGDSVATATVAATAAITAAAVVIVAGIGIHTRFGIEITKLTQDILVLLHIAESAQGFSSSHNDSPFRG
jgi:hypothetical protein